MSARAPEPGRARTALVLVRNTVSHDNRVLREVDTLRRCGFSVLVVGVVSTAERARRASIRGVEVVRIDPLAGLPRRRRPPASRGPLDATPAAAPSPAIAPAPPPAPAPAPNAAGPANRLRLAAHIRRLLTTAAYYRRAIALCRRARPALVHANDYNTMWIGLAAKLLCGSRVLYDSHELWPDRNGRPEWRPWLIACEALFVRAADVTITASPGYAEMIARRYRVARPAVVRNIPGELPRTVPEPSESGAPLAIYLGGLMPGRGLEPGIAALAQAPRMRMRLIGPGAERYRAGLHALAAECGVAERLELCPPVAPGEVLAAIAGASVGLMLIQPVCRSYELTLPNKLFEYAAAGLPILASELPVIGGIVREHGLGEVVAPDDVPGIAAALERLAEPQYNRVLSARVRAFARANAWEHEREALAGIYSSLVP